MRIDEQAPRQPSEMFAEQMRIQRERKGWTQKQLANKLVTLGFPVHQTTVGKWESGDRRITIDDALAISAALDVCPAFMLSGAYLPVSPNSAVIALSEMTAPVSGLEMRMWMRGQQPLWEQDERRYFTEVPSDEWHGIRSVGMGALLQDVQRLVHAWGAGDRRAVDDTIDAIDDELERQRRALHRELSA